MESLLDSSSESREKKTRRRLRLSCVECTKRRQKCDRNHPCSLCITRGVPHLCRWESVPLARPAPARPPVTAVQENIALGSSAHIQELQQRVEALEKELARTREECNPLQRNHLSEPHSNQTTPPPSDIPDINMSINITPARLSDLSQASSSSPEDMADYPLAPPEDMALDKLPFSLDDVAYEATALLAQLSLAHHGEFIGRGSLICALHSITAKSSPRFLYTKSTEPMMGYRESVQRFSNMPFASCIEDLVSNLPPALVIEALTGAFFAEVNWRYGIPETWFCNAMLEMSESLQQYQGPDSINAHWLMLVFAVLASAPKSAYDDVAQYSVTRCNDDYFMCSMMARRIAEDEYLNTANTSMMVSAADGTVLGCLAALLLCHYLAERGRVSEAWKLAGNAIRNAESVGMHRDPDWKLWQTMSADEKLLRRRAWWGLFISDKTYSYILARPQVLRRETSDVTLSLPFNPDGSRNLFNVGQAVLVSLAELMGESSETCFSVVYPDCIKFLQMDTKFEQWEERLPAEYRIDYDLRMLQDCDSAGIKLLTRQRYTIHSWYLIARLKLHIASTTGQGRPPQLPLHIRQSMERCTLIAMQIIRLQTAAFNAVSSIDGDTPVSVYPGSLWLFEGCFSLFEASVALITTMAKRPWQEKIAEAALLIESALLAFDAVRLREHGKTAETANRAIEVLVTIREQHWPETRNILQYSKVKNDPEKLGRSASNRSLMNFPEAPEACSISNVFSSSTQFTVSSVRDNDSSQAASFGRIAAEVYTPDIRMTEDSETLRAAIVG
ncbi:hypothetical protein B0H34DRAFT_355803 [Crassisporium funariophilum]|nr:hypothetical protein B0H34DRAFT_355803 [Crassisporium funariophilum]